MSETKFTPAPWWPDFGEAYNVRAPHLGIVAQIHHLKGRHGMGGRIDASEAAANARLIAAAPELYEALVYHLEITRMMQNGEASEDFKRIDALLKKARGQA